CGPPWALFHWSRLSVFGQGASEWAGEAARFPRRLPAPRQRGGREINTEERCCQGHGAMGARVPISVNSHQLNRGPTALTLFMQRPV
ncbi:hypothetical protein M9458_044038, partial [Cirrhinus mrigala]